MSCNKRWIKGRRNQWGFDSLKKLWVVCFFQTKFLNVFNIYSYFIADMMFMFRCCPVCTSELISARKMTESKWKTEKSFFLQNWNTVEIFSFLLLFFWYVCLVTFPNWKYLKGTLWSSVFFISFTFTYSK